VAAKVVSAPRTSSAIVDGGERNGVDEGDARRHGPEEETEEDGRRTLTGSVCPEDARFRILLVRLRRKAPT
jgi:hypothetical protein